MCKILNNSHQMSTPFQPQGNSRIERMVKNVENLISAFCKTYHEWDQNFPLLSLAYRATVHEVMGFTQSFLVTGLEVNLPLDVMLGMASLNYKVTASKYVN